MSTYRRQAWRRVYTPGPVDLAAAKRLVPRLLRTYRLIATSDSTSPCWNCGDQYSHPHHSEARAKRLHFVPARAARGRRRPTRREWKAITLCSQCLTGERRPR